MFDHCFPDEYGFFGAVPKIVLLCSSSDLSVYKLEEHF